MAIKKYNKLVRDKIPEIIKEDNNTPFTHIADEKEYWEKLKLKLKEEIDEFLEEENENEFVDVLEVLEAISWYKKFDKNQIRKLKYSKQEKRGGFKKKIILEKVKE